MVGGLVQEHDVRGGPATCWKATNIPLARHPKPIQGPRGVCGVRVMEQLQHGSRFFDVLSVFP